MNKLILITNDDGVKAQGIDELTQLMQPLGDVIVVAPDSARSGAGCSITPTTPISLHCSLSTCGLFPIGILSLPWPPSLSATSAPLPLVW